MLQLTEMRQRQTSSIHISGQALAIERCFANTTADTALRWSTWVERRMATMCKSTLDEAMSQADASHEQRYRGFMLLVCGIAQLSVYGVALFVAANDFRGPEPWPVVVAFGAILAQCCLSAAFAVFGPWLFPLRSLVSATIVVIGGLLIIVAESRRPALRFEDAVLFGLFALLMWGIIQAPLWFCRFFLHARAVTGASPDNKAIHQYRIRQLMGLTLAVSLVLGLGRMVVPAQAFRDLANVQADDWILLASIAIAAGLIVSTTIMTTLNPYYWRIGIGVSAASAGLVAYGMYSIAASLAVGPTKDSVAFAVLIVSTYAWLQISVLLIRAAGYRICVRSRSSMG